MGACEEVGSAEQVGGRGGRGEAKGLNFKKILKKKKKKKKSLKCSKTHGGAIPREMRQQRGWVPPQMTHPLPPRHPAWWTLWTVVGGRPCIMQVGAAQPSPGHCGPNIAHLGSYPPWSPGNLLGTFPLLPPSSSWSPYPVPSTELSIILSDPPEPWMMAIRQTRRFLTNKKGGRIQAV